MFDKQKQIENELFKEYDKNLDRSFSLLKFIFVILGFYALVLSNMYGNFNGKIADNIINNASDPNIAKSALSCCIITIIIPFSSLTMILMEQQLKIEKNNSIQFREGEELKNHNEKMYSVLVKQHIKYITSVFCIVSSVFFFYSYFSPHLFNLILICFGVGIFISFVSCHFPQIITKILLRYRQMRIKILQLYKRGKCVEPEVQTLNLYTNEGNTDKKC